MRLVSFDHGFGRVVDGTSVAPMGRDIRRFLAEGEAGTAFLGGYEASTETQSLPLEKLGLRAPVPSPGKIVAIGLNYRDHAAEAKLPVPPEPVLFAKFANSVIGSGESVRVPPAARDQLDYEAELGVVIGRTARRVSSDQALDHVAGYMCVNDISCRSLQLRTSQWMRGKAIDTFLPCGPWLVTSDEIPDPQRLTIASYVNGELRQHSSTEQMIWGVAELISFISATITLEPGDVIATGTPAGVGTALTPPRYLTSGDLVEVEITSLGRLSNRVAFEQLH